MEKASKTESESKSETPPTRFSRWMRKHLVSNVPAEIAACEFECSVEKCAHERWVTCERRLKRMAERTKKAS